MLPGAVGSRWIPRKMAGMAMITMDVSIAAMVMLSVVLESATHLYLLSPGSWRRGLVAVDLVVLVVFAAPLVTTRTLARLRI